MYDITYQIMSDLEVMLQGQQNQGDPVPSRSEYTFLKMMTTTYVKVFTRSVGFGHRIPVDSIVI